MHSNSKNLLVVYEDNHIIVVNKRAGDIVQGDKTGDLPLSEVVKIYLKKKYNKPGAVFLGVAHRLDRPTSGLVLFAKTSKALQRLNRMLQERTIEKTYWAIVQGTPSKAKDRLVHWLKRNPKQNKSYAFAKEIAQSKKAILHYTIIKKLEKYTLLEILLETGRHHQIRSQLQAIGHVIKGDLKYGAKRSNKDGGIHLHARKLSFIHPVKKEPLLLTAPLPQETLWQQI
ncbi:MAG: RluA family pseudouridine synthase [Flavobacteriaceae bacterium]|nr:RluA family pseudouridine synthase [Flavobacteriaceae bacterium]